MSAVDKKISDNLPDLPINDGEPLFRAPWEAQAFAMAVSLNEKGLFSWKEWAAELSDVIAQDSGVTAAEDYYHLWLDALERIVMKKTDVSAAEISHRRADWEHAVARTPHGQPIILD